MKNAESRARRRLELAKDIRPTIINESLIIVGLIILLLITILSITYQ